MTEPGSRATQSGEAAGPRVQRITDIARLGEVANEWDRFVAEAGSDIYFTIDWLQAWWTHYGSGRRLECLLVRQGEDLIAVLPFFVQRHWVGPVPVVAARFVGADSTIPVFNPPVRPGSEVAAVAAAAEFLLGEAGCHVVALTALSGESTFADAATCLPSDSSTAVVRSDTTGPHTVFRFPETFDDYLATLSKSQRQNHRRYLRQLNKAHDIGFRTISGTDAIACLDRFVELHRRHWEAEGKLGHFGDWPDSESFNRDLLTRFADRDLARFYEITADGRTIAIEFSFVLDDRCFWRLPARDPDPELQKMRLGRVSLAEMFRVLIGDGRRMVDGGPGHYDYKSRLGAAEHELRRVVLSRRSPMARRRASLLLRWADLLHLGYYRMWFLKLGPRLGRAQRPLWRPWIRTRF